MRDRYESEMWLEHHDQFSAWMGGLLHRLAGPLRRTLDAAPRAAAHLVAASFAISFTVLTLGASIA